MVDSQQDGVGFLTCFSPSLFFSSSPAPPQQRSCRSPSTGPPARQPAKVAKPLPFLTLSPRPHSPARCRALLLLFVATPTFNEARLDVKRRVIGSPSAGGAVCLVLTAGAALRIRRGPPGEPPPVWLSLLDFMLLCLCLFVSFFLLRCPFSG